MKTLFTINAVVAGLIGLGFLLLPGQVTGLYGLVEPGAAVMARFFGASLLGYALIYWLLRESAPSLARRGVMIASAFVEYLGTLVVVLLIISGDLNAFGWPTALLFLAFGIAYTVFLTKEPQPFEAGQGAA